MGDDLRAKAELLLALHQPGRPLVLVNVWDAASARIVEDAGLPAVATTSAGIAFCHGYPDGQKIPRDLMLEAISRICRAVSVPVTADMEAGYGPTADEVREAAGRALEAGAAGLNLEDGTGDAAGPLASVSLQREKIRAIREAGDARGVPIVINARTDVFLDAVGAPEAGSPPIRELSAAGVARVSLGSGPMRATMSLLQRLIQEAITQGSYTELEGIVSHASMNGLMR
ncbi:MAG: isocitrate lyase/phosphoenolpyruvate mutase family protein [Acidobacteria bacterium]|nr:isocitrate lyase/phosphoenolpyruvate mutase family protein [Acidobacteriota bacterium]